MQSELLPFVHNLLDKAGAISLQYFRKPLSIENKQDNSPVTKADKEIEHVWREAIYKNFPDHGVLGEEEKPHALDAKVLWILDPIDGTRSFMTGSPLFGNLITVFVEGKPILGAVNIPATRERWIAGDGIKTTLNGESCRVNSQTELKSASIYTTTPDMFMGGDKAVLNALQTSARQVRYGGDCYNYGLLASGYVDAVVEADLKPWDMMAMVSIVENAGGIVTDWRGNPLTLENDGRVVATATKSLHQQIILKTEKFDYPK